MPRNGLTLETMQMLTFAMPHFLDIWVDLFARTGLSRNIYKYICFDKAAENECHFISWVRQNVQESITLMIVRYLVENKLIFKINS